MPLPKPHKGEKEKDFISRCMSDDVINEDYPDNDQRLAVCYSIWNRNKENDMNIEHKSIQIELKDDTPGAFIARIAKLNEIDHDNDVTLPGAFPDGKIVLVSAYGHGSWMGELPVGKAVIKESGNQVIAEGEFNLKTDTGREHYETVKFSDKLQEWSYGFKPIEFEFGEKDEQEVRFLKKVDPFEISPVIKGAGKNTATLAIKAGLNHRNNSADEGLAYADQAETVLAAVKELGDRTKSLADLRRSEGKELSEINRERISQLLISLEKTEGEVKELIESTQPVDKSEIEKLMIQFTKIQSEILEVK